MDAIEWLLHRGDELRQLVKDNPDLPVVFQCDTNSEYDVYIASSVYVQVMDVLSVPGPNDKKWYYDRDEIAEDIRDYLEGEGIKGLTDDEVDALVERKTAEYDKHWVKAIVVFLRP